jgi:hypothetical protein
MTQLPPTSVYPQVPDFGPPPPPKSHAGLWIGLAIAAVLLLCAGGVGVGAIVFLANRHQQTDPTSIAAAPATSAPAKKAETEKVTLTAPDAIGSRAKSTDPQLTQTIEGAKQQMSTLANGAGDPVAAFYGSAEKKDLMMVFAVPTPVNAGAMPDSQFDMIFTMMGSMTGGKAGAAQSVDPGALGGKAKCSDLTVKDTPIALCAWADAGSFAFILWYFTKVETAKAEFVSVREQIEHRG